MKTMDVTTKDERTTKMDERTTKMDERATKMDERTRKRDDVKTGPQTVTKEVDIPDAEAKEKKTIVLDPEVQAERDVRRYIRKDGVFIKDVEYLWYTPTGRILANGVAERTLTKTKEAAEEFVTELCEKSGRTVELDPVSKRPKATPGWDLSIRVPGMQDSEMFAPKTSQGDLQQAQTSELMARLIADNRALADQVKGLVEKMDADAGAIPAAQKGLQQMNHKELDAYAAQMGRPLGFTDKPTRAEKAATIKEAIEALKTDPV